MTNPLKSLLTFKFWKEFVVMTLGMLVAAAAVYYFLVPSKLIIGTISGLSIVVSGVLEGMGIIVKVSTVVVIVNAILLVLAFFLIGNEFGIKTVYTALILGPLMDLLDKVYPYTKFLTEPGQTSVMGDIWFDLCCFVLLLSASQAILFRINASTGGLDILAKIVNKYLHFDIGASVSVAGAVICCTAFAINPFKMVIIGLIGTWINGLVVDYFTASLNKRKRVRIITKDYELVREFIIHRLIRGCSIYDVTGGYTGESQKEIQSLLSQSEFSDLMKFISEKKINAFISAGNVSEVYGLWFGHDTQKKLSKMGKTSIIVLALLFPSNLRAEGRLDIDKTIASMTLEEKASMLVGVWEEGMPSNIISSAGRTHPLEWAGIPSTVMNDGASGLRMDTLRAGYPDKRYYCTGFPVATLLASTWNDEILRKVGGTIASEMKHYGCDLLLAPSLNIQRNPLCGRNFEYLSEDPYLAGHSAAQLVKGIQAEGAGATLKHFAANNQQSARVNNDARVSQRALREIYLRAFEIAVKEGQPWAVMTALNKINGTRACASEPLLTGILRDEWGWDGVVMTDWFQPEVTSDCVHAGNDLLMGGSLKQKEDIIVGVRDGSISIADVDRNVRNVLEYVVKTGSYAGLVPDYEPDLKADALVALEAAEEGIVLLKNEGGCLPLSDDDDVAVFGVGSYLFYANGLGCADVNKPYTVNLLQGMKEAGIHINPIVDEFYRRYFEAQDVQLRESNAPTWKNWFFGYKMPSEAELRSFFIDKRAADCSKAIITIARNCGEALDRDYAEGEYLLTSTEKKIVSDVCRSFHAKGKPVVLILNTGAPIEISPVVSEVDAVLLAWQPGQEGGRAVANVLSGSVNPSGKLPVTWENSWEDIPSSKNFPIHYTFNWDDVKPFGRRSLLETRNLGYTEYEEGIWVGYRYFNTFEKPVAFPFGYGLSYTTFEWSDARIEKRTRDAVTVSIVVRNTGSLAGKDVVELYSSSPVEGFETPLRELRAYCKTRLLAPGESQKIVISLKFASLASFHEDSSSWITTAGPHTLSFCSSVESVRQTLELTLSRDLCRKVSFHLCE